jgi:hypothetical protein
MAQVEDYIKVFEATDGGSGDPAKTFWQFFVGAQPVTTKNPLIAETMMLAVNTQSKVRVIFDPADGNTMAQARMEFSYVCNSRKIEKCQPPDSPAPDDSPAEICETIRYAPCHRN